MTYVLPPMKSPRHIHRRITTELRERILRGEWRPGRKLPRMHDLAREYGTSYFTVQTALTPLVEQGLLERRRRVGTVVRHNPAVLTCAGIYCSGSLLHASSVGSCGCNWTERGCGPNSSWTRVRTRNRASRCPH